MLGFLLITFMFITFAIGVPVAFALGGSAMLAILLSGADIPLMTIPQKMMASVSSTTLLAIPMFILAGNLMSKGGMSRRIVNLAMAFIGRKTGGLTSVSILSTMVFSALSGSSSATAAAIGTIMIPEMERYNYDKSFAGATIASSAELGVIIPPSCSMIVFGMATNTSVAGMFMGGIIPGILIGLSLIMVAYFISRKHGFKGVPDNEELPNKFVAFRESFLAIMMPLIVLGGIYGGIFTPVEAAGVAVLYGFIVGVLVYRDIDFKTFMEVLFTSAKQTTMIMMLIAGAGIFGYVLGVERIPDAIAQFVIGLTNNPIVFLLLMNILLFFLGMLVESAPLILIIGPIFAPIAASYGIDPIHFGVIFVVNVAIGMVTPPVGLNLYVTCNVANLTIEKLARWLVPYLIVLFVDLMIISYIPSITMAIPHSLGF